MKLKHVKRRFEKMQLKVFEELKYLKNKSINNATSRKNIKLSMNDAITNELETVHYLIINSKTVWIIHHHSAA